MCSFAIFWAVRFPCSYSLQLDAIELWRVAGRDGVGGMEGSIRVEGIGEQHCPVYQRHGHVARGQNDITAVRPAVRPAENKTASRHRDAVDGRLRRRSNHLQFAAAELSCVPCQTSSGRGGCNVRKRTRITRRAENLEAVAYRQRRTADIDKIQRATVSNACAGGLDNVIYTRTIQ